MGESIGIKLNLVASSDKEPEKFVSASLGKKNNRGGLKHRDKRQKRIKHYARGDDMPEQCLVCLCKSYVSKCPKSALEKDVFYVAPLRKYNFAHEGMEFLLSIG